MNPLTNVRNQNLMNDREINLGIAGTKQSWHREYKDSAWVFIGGLPYDLTEGDVICVFSQYGEVVNINLVRDKKTGKSKGYCFLCYEDQRSTDLAVDNFNGAKVLGRTLKVDHVSNYRMPKDHGEEDEITVALREGGCAPQPIGESDSEDEEELMPLLPLETKKKKKKKKEKKNKKHKRRKTSSSEQSTDDERDVRRPKVKKEKHAKQYYSDNESLSTSSDDYKHKTNKKPKKLSEKPKLKEVRHDSDSDDSVESHNGGSKNSSSRQRSEDMSLGTKTKSGRYHDERQDRSNDYGRSTTEHNRSRHGSRSVERMRIRDGDRDRQRDEDMSREKYRSREQNRPRAWSRERNSPMGQSRERKRSRDRSNEMHRSRDWSKERHTSRERNRSREINRFGERDRSKYDSNRNRDYHGHRRH